MHTYPMQEAIMKSDDRPEPAKRLEKARIQRGFATAKDATRLLALAAAALLTACASSTPQVSDFNGDSVRVKVYCGLAYDCTRPRAEDQAQAEQTCATRGRKAQYASSVNRMEPVGGTSVDTYEHLYICVCSPQD